MKIIYEIERLSTNGGINRILTDRINYMAEKWGWEITIITLFDTKRSPFFNLSSKVKTIELGIRVPKPLNWISALWQLNNIVNKLRPNVYVTFQTIGALSCLIKTHKVPTIYEAHSTKACMPHQFAINIAERFADHIVVLGEDHAKDYAKANRLSIIPNFSLMKPFRQPNYNSKIAIAVGRRSAEKNFERLEYIWDKVSTIRPDWQLKIHHNTKNILNAYQEASILLMTSQFEAFPMVLLEAMTCGLPCIAFDCPHGPREIIEDGKTGYLIPYDDDEMFIEKLTYLMEHPEVRERMGQAAQESVKRFSVETIMEKWRKLYEG